MSNLHRFKEQLKEMDKFTDKIIKLFSIWDGTYDGMGDGMMTLKNVINQINDVLIFEKEENLEYNIILEGCDGVGKTSIFEELMHRGLFGKRMIGIQHKNKMPPKNYKDGMKLNEELLQESNSITGLVFDRHILSERVYAPILRGYFPYYIDNLEKQLKPYNYLFLITADLKAVKKRFDGEGISIDSISQILNAYQFHFYRCRYPHKFIIDTTNITPFQALKEIERLIKTEEN